MFSGLVNNKTGEFCRIMKEILRIIREWFARDHTRLALGIGIFSAGLAGYSLGILRDNAQSRIPLVMNIVPPQEIPMPQVLGDTSKASPVAKTNTIATPEGTCAFVGSKNSTLYHLPTCAPAKRIKDTNKVCFASKESAEAKGYKPGCLK